MLSDEAKTDLMVFKSYLDEGNSITVSKKKTFGRINNKNRDRVNRMVYTNEYVDILNEYMEKVRKPIKFILTKHGIESIKQYICKICNVKKTRNEFYHKNSTTCAKCDCKRSNEKSRLRSLRQREELDRKLIGFI